MDLLRAMESFVRVAHTGSFTAAANQLNQSPSVITRQLLSLEQSLGVKLINRSTRRLSLTSAGDLYLRQCRDILDRISFAAQSLHSSPSDPQGDIRFGMPSSFGLEYAMPLLTQFVKTYPKVRLQLVVGDDCLDLITHRLDMAIHITSSLDQNLVAKHLLTSRRQLVASPEYLAGHVIPVHPRELDELACLGASEQETWSFMIDERIQGLSIASQFSSHDICAQRSAAIAGLGIAYLPDFAVNKAISNGQLIPLLEEFTRIEQSVSLVCPGPRYISNQVRVLAEYLVMRIMPLQAGLFRATN